MQRLFLKAVPKLSSPELQEDNFFKTDGLNKDFSINARKFKGFVLKKKKHFSIINLIVQTRLQSFTKLKQGPAGSFFQSSWLSQAWQTEPKLISL